MSDQKIKVLREILPEWEEVIKIAESMVSGEIVIKIHQRKISITEYTIKRKPEEKEEINIIEL